MGFAETFKALSDPQRREILSLLKDRKLSAGDIAARFPVTGATMSYHLNVLKRAGLVFESREKNFIFYQLNTSVLEDVLLWLSDLRGTAAADGMENGNRTESGPTDGRRGVPENGNRTKSGPTNGRRGVPENGNRTESELTDRRRGVPENGNRTKSGPTDGRRGVPENGNRTESGPTDGKRGVPENGNQTKGAENHEKDGTDGKPV